MNQKLKRYGRVLKLKPEYENEYMEYHAKLWPEVKKAIYECGIRNYSIYLHNGYLFAYMEMVGDNDLKTLDEKWFTYEACVKWENIMNKMQEKAPGAKENEWWSEMHEIFHVD
jgi:Uncharacterized conserved protein